MNQQVSAVFSLVLENSLLRTASSWHAGNTQSWRDDQCPTIKGSELRNDTIEYTGRTPSPMQHTGDESSKPRDATWRLLHTNSWPALQTKMALLEVTGMIECDKLRDILYFLATKFVTDVPYLLWGCLLYELNTNIRWTEIHSTVHDGTWKPQEVGRNTRFTSLYGHFHRRNV